MSKETITSESQDGQDHAVVDTQELQKGIGEVLSHIVRTSREKLLSTPADKLEQDYWLFRFDDTKSAFWNIYQFSERLEAYKRDMRRWEEHHNGSMCVVERVRDRYLKPQINKFAEQLKSL